MKFAVLTRPRNQSGIATGSLPEAEVVHRLFEDGGPPLLLRAVEHGGDAVVVAGEVVEQDQVAPLQQLLQGRGISFWNRNSSC